MLIDYFGKDYYSLIGSLKKKGKVYPETQMSGNDCIRCIIYFREKANNDEGYYLHIEIFSIYNLDLEHYTSLEKSLQNTVERSLSSSLGMKPIGYGYKRYNDADNSIFLLNIFHTEQVDCYIIDKPKPQNSQASLLKLNLSHNNKENNERICNTLQQKIEQYSQSNNVTQNNIRLSLTRLFGFERLKFNANELEKYIQFKNQVLSHCTKEELNEQAEKFINPHNYPRYFKSEIVTCLGTSIVQKMGSGYSKAACNALDSFNPDTSLQTLQILALAAIGKFAG